MAINKGRHESDFTTVYNQTARDTNLSLQARGLLLYMLSLPGNWKVYRKQLAADNNINEKTVQKYMNELKENGYAEYIQTRKNGRLTGGEYYIYPIPQKHLKATGGATSTTDPKNGPVEKAPGEKHTHIQKKEVKKEILSSVEVEVDELSSHFENYWSESEMPLEDLKMEVKGYVRFCQSRDTIPSVTGLRRRLEKLVTDTVESRATMQIKQARTALKEEVAEELNNKAINQWQKNNRI